MATLLTQVGLTAFNALHEHSRFFKSWADFTLPVLSIMALSSRHSAFSEYGDFRLELPFLANNSIAKYFFPAGFKDINSEVF